MDILKRMSKRVTGGSSNRDSASGAPEKKKSGSYSVRDSVNGGNSTGSGTTTVVHVPMFHSYKIGVVGPSNAGKTRFSIRYTQQVYSETYEYEETIEDTYVKQTQINLKQYYEEQGIEDEQHARNIIVKFELVDTSGNEENIEMGEIKWGEMDGFILVYDVTSQDSLNQIQRFYDRIVESKGLGGASSSSSSKSHHSNGSSNMGGGSSSSVVIQIPMVLVANKMDLIPSSSHSSAPLVLEGAKLARTLGCKFMKTSCKDNVDPTTGSIEECFEQVVKEIINVKYMKPDDQVLAALFGFGMGSGGEGTDKMDNRKSIKELKDLVNKRLSRKL